MDGNRRDVEFKICSIYILPTSHSQNAYQQYVLDLVYRSPELKSSTASESKLESSMNSHLVPRNGDSDIATFPTL